MSDDLNSWLNSGSTHIDEYKTNKEKRLGKSDEITSAPTAAVRGALSGATMGTWPAIAGGLTTGFGLLGDYDKSKAESQAAQDKAWEERPGWYGTGYGAGTVGSLVAGPGLLGRGAMAAGRIAEPIAVKAIPSVLNAAEAAMPGSRALGELGQGFGEGVHAAAKEAGLFDKLGNYLAGSASVKGIPLGSRAGTPARLGMVGTELYTGANGPNLPTSDEDNLEKRRYQMNNNSVPKE